MHNHNLDVSPDRIDEIVQNRKIRRATTKACHQWFFHIYFSHYTKFKTAQFHKELFELTEDTNMKTLVIEAFRGSGKTTIMGTSYAIWSILGCQQKKFVLIIAKTESQARQYLANIKLELENNRLLRLDLGPFEEPNDEWRAVSIVLPKYGARIMVASIEGSVRGVKHGAHRPDLIIADDLEDLNIVKTQESRDKLFDWLTSDIMPLGDKDTRLIVIGTKLHNDSVIMRLKKAILEGRMNGVTKAYPFLKEDSTAMWPEKFPTQADIDTLKKSVPSIQSWQREYMLQIIADDDQVVRPEWIQKYNKLPVETNFRYVATGIDPAISEKETADYTAMVSGKIYGRRSGLKIYIQPNPVNERMDFPKTLEKIRKLNMHTPTQLFVESIAYQRSLIEQLKTEGLLAKEYKSQGSDKRARLSLVSSIIQSGKVLFPEYGAESLISQILGFGTEKHDDLMDAFCILVLSVLEQESKTIKGYIELFSEQLLNSCYHEKISLVGEKRLGVILADKYRQYSTIVIKVQNAAEVLYHEVIDDPIIVARKVIELAKKYDVPLSDQNIFVDKAGRGRDLCMLIASYAQGNFIVGKYEMRQKYGIDVNEKYQYNDGLYEDQYAAGYAKLAKWLRNGSRLVGRPMFDDLLSMVYTDQSGKMKMIDKDTLIDQGIDVSIPDALALTTTKEKREINRPREDEYWEEDAL
jgi:predicted phage terminase large subunit-like protein